MITPHFLSKWSLRPNAPVFLLCGAALFAAVSPLPIAAQSAPSVITTSENEIARRQARVTNAEALLEKSRRAAADKNPEAAYSLALQSVDLLPGGLPNDPNRASTISAFSQTAMDYANWLISQGRYQDAERVAKTILSPAINPNFKPAARLLANLEQTDYYNKTIDPAFAAEREDVQKLLNQAEGYAATGRYDLATKRYEQVLNLDRYNTAARNGMEAVNKQRTTYYDQAYNETRSRMLWEVEQAWERPVPKRNTSTRSTASSTFQAANESKALITKKLNDIVIKEINFPEITIREFVDFLKNQSRQLDPSKQGVNIVLKLSQQPTVGEDESTDVEDSTDSQATPSTKISISPPINNIPLGEAIRYLTELTDLKYKIDPFAVEILSPTASTEDLVTKEHRVSPGFIPVTPSDDTALPTAGGRSSSGETRLLDRRDAKKFLEEQGVPFTSGEAFARYIPSGSRLIVRNTQSAIDTIDTIIEGEMGVPPNQVEIESKFIEISQNNLNELGFDWLLGPFSIGGGVYGDGGTIGLGQETSGDYYSNYPFSQVGGNPVTAGTRSGIGTSLNSAITANSIDALIAQVPQGFNVATPGIFGIAGVFTNPQFQMVIRALNQKKGIDLMSAPKVTTKSGSKATVKIVRDFPYPQNFDPPEVPESSSSNSTSTTAGIVVTSSIVTPANPTDFTNRELGVTLEVEPVVGADNYTIDLYLSPRVVNFDGFVNYGSPVIGPRYNPASILTGNPSGIETYVITPNTMNQPIFSVRSVDTNVTVWDGQTVALGGLIREDVQKVQDKVPLLGDIPLAGRLFRSNVDQTIKKNLIIFVTARLINAQGQPLIQQDDEEDFVEPLGLPEDLPQPTFQTQKFGK
jgi:general secretion pathway protein D